MSQKLSNAPVPTEPAGEKIKQWRDFVAASPYGDVLQCIEWGAVKRPEWYPLPVALEAAGRYDATALVLRRDLGRTGHSFFYLPRGPILDWDRPGVAESMMGRLKELAGPHKAAFIKIDPCVPDDTPGFKEKIGALGFVPSPDAAGHFGGTQPRCNMKLSLKGSLDDIQARFHQKWRYNIRLATKKGVEVHMSSEKRDLKVFHDIYKVTSDRNEFTGRPLSYFEKMWDALAPAGLMKLFVVYHDSVPLSAAICFLLPPQCWYVYGASSNQGRNLMPNHLMQWTMIQWAKENGCTLYDFRGVPDPEHGDIPPEEEGLVRFKSGFGAEMIRYAGEYDLVLNRKVYWAWTNMLPKVKVMLRKIKR